MRSTPEDFRKLREILKSKPLEWSSHVLSRLQSGERTLRTQDEIIALLRSKPVDIRYYRALVKAYYATNEGNYCIVLSMQRKTIRIVTFMDKR